MAATDLISLIICINNVDVRLFRDCIRSIQGQTLRPNEYEVIIDMLHDGSASEALANFATDLARDNENFILIQHKENEGLTAARKSGFDASSGKYVVFLDGTDMLARDALEQLREIAFSDKADIVTCAIEKWNPYERRLAASELSMKPINPEYVPRLRELHRHSYLFTLCGRLIRREIISPDVFDVPKGHSYDDMVTTPRLFYYARTVSNIPDVLYYYTVNKASMAGSICRKHIDDVFHACRDWYENALQKQYIVHIFHDIPVGVGHVFCDLVSRVLTENGLDPHEKAELLKLAHKYYADYPLTSPGTDDECAKAFGEILTQHKPGMDTWLVESLAALFEERITGAYGPQLFPIGIEPTPLALRLKGKIVFVCLVDYHLRNAASVARVLRQRGRECVIVDYSILASGGKRQLRHDESAIFEDIVRIPLHDQPRGRDWLATAQLVLIYNDWNPDLRDAIEYRALMGLPIVGMVEGISDFLRQDLASYLRLPYRRTEYVFLTGEYDKQFFSDRKTYVVGLPEIDRLRKKEPVFPSLPLAVINVNFTYGQLEWHRRRFVDSAIEACRRVGIEYIITQHPSDDGLHDGYPISKKSQYRLIDECSLFISRFATGIIESIASGKPAVYFNPNIERVDKFQNPLGAFRVAEDVDELAKAIRDTLSDINNAVDVRERAAQFLKHHTNTDGSSSPTERTASEILRVVGKNVDGDRKMLEALLQRVQPGLKLTDEAGAIGIFARDQHAILPETQLIAHYFGCRGGVMFDVGASVGNSCDLFLGKGWFVHAFEPDPRNRERLRMRFGDEDNLIINSEAVTDVSGQEKPFYASEESVGISGLSAFTSGHQQMGTVATITLMDYCERNAIGAIDFLKIDVEGYDKFVLDGFPWDRIQPEVVLAEFEDAKTVALGYNIHDLAQVLLEKDYAVYVSEWHPIIRYGIAHDWRQLVRYRQSLELSATWGNLIAFAQDPGLEKLRELALKTLEFSGHVTEPRAPDITQVEEHEGHAALTTEPRAPDITQVEEHEGHAALTVAKRSAPRRFVTALLKPLFFAAVAVVCAFYRTSLGSRVKAKIEALYCIHIKNCLHTETSG